MNQQNGLEPSSDVVPVPPGARARVAQLWQDYQQARQALFFYAGALHDSLGLEGEWDLDPDAMIFRRKEASVAP